MVARSNRTWGITGDFWQYAHHLSMFKGGEVAREGVYLIDNAAGSVDPATGAGIGMSLWTGSMARSAIAASVEGVREAHARYEAWFQAVLVPYLQAAQSLRNWVFLQLYLPWRAAGVLRYLIEVLGGLSTYTDWAKAHPLTYRAGRLLQRYVDRQMGTV